MGNDESLSFNVEFPGDLEYIPAVRGLIADVLTISGFGVKFAYRSEIIVDEVCNNAVSHGSINPDARVFLDCTIDNDRVDFNIRDEGGESQKREQLRRSVEQTSESSVPVGREQTAGLGLEIVKMLSEKIDFRIDENNLTSVHIVRRREDVDGKK